MTQLKSYDSGSGQWVSVVAGAPGLQGTSGTNGAQGTQGVYGNTGTQGVQGIYGTTGDPLLPTTTVGTATYTLSLSDVGKLILLNAQVNVYVNTSVTYPVGCQINFVQMQNYQSTFSGLSGAVIYSSLGNKMRTQYSMATMVQTSSGVWVISGDMSN